MKNARRYSAWLLAVVVLGANILVAGQASAASLSNTYLRLNRMASGTATSARLVFKTSASAGGTSVSINMNGGDTTTWTGSGGVVATSQTASSASCAADTGATALPGTLAAAGSGSTITITGITAMSASTAYCVDLTSASAVTNPTSAGEYHPVITNVTNSDSTTVAVRVITNDQVVVNATVAPTFNFVLSGNSDNFASNLSAGSVASTNGVTATVNTNAKNGWMIWAKDSNTGLNSSTQSKTIAATTAGSSATLTAGTEGYVFGLTNVTQGSGVGVAAPVAAYDATASGGVNNVGGGLDGSLRQVASSNGTANGAILTFKERAAISAVTPAAADYTDSVTLIGAGNF